MPEPIFMRIGETPTVEFSDLVGAMGNFLGLLKEVDSAVANKKSGNLRWKVTTLSKDKFPLIGVTPSLRRELDTSARVEIELITNVVSLTERGERNRFFSDAAISRVERIARTTPRIGASSIFTNSRKETNLTTAVTSKTLAQLEELTHERSISFGALTGELGSISVRKGKEFRVWDEDTSQPVRCTFRSHHEARAKDLLGQRIVATGLIKADRNGRPISMTVENLEEIISRSDLPTIEEMRGLIPHFTGGLNFAEFFEDQD